MKCQLCLLVVFATCVGPAAAQDYYPLKKGNRWTYRVFDTKEKDAEVRKVIIEVERDEPYTRKVKKDKADVVETHAGFLLKMTSGGKVSTDGKEIVGGKTTVDHVVVVPNEGIYRVHTAGTPTTPPILFVKLPAKPGDTWEVNSMSGNATIKGTFTAKNDKIGRFDAFFVAYREVDSPVEIDNWFVQGIGMIKQRVKTKNTEVVLQLEEYSLAK